MPRRVVRQSILSLDCLTYDISSRVCQHPGPILVILLYGLCSKCGIRKAVVGSNVNLKCRTYKNIVLRRLAKTERVNECWLCCVSANTASVSYTNIQGFHVPTYSARLQGGPRVRQYRVHLISPLARSRRPSAVVETASKKLIQSSRRLHGMGCSTDHSSRDYDFLVRSHIINESTALNGDAFRSSPCKKDLFRYCGLVYGEFRGFHQSLLQKCFRRTSCLSIRVQVHCEPRPA